MINIEALERFNTEDGHYRIIKLETKRTSMVGVGAQATGTFTLAKINGEYKVNVGLWTGITTSVVAKIVDTTENTVMFETEGGTYKLIRVEE